MLTFQHAHEHHREFDSFDKAVDEFFSAIESQKLDSKSQAKVWPTAPALCS